ncbi:MAG: hypothetical protein Q9218_003255 [Villophora microphyllina]
MSRLLLLLLPLSLALFLTYKRKRQKVKVQNGQATAGTTPSDDEQKPKNTYDELEKKLASAIGSLGYVETEKRVYEEDLNNTSSDMAI